MYNKGNVLTLIVLGFSPPLVDNSSRVSQLTQRKAFPVDPQAYSTALGSTVLVNLEKLV